MYEIFDHTADLGLRIRAADLATLMSEAGRALFSVIVADLGKIQPREQVELRIPFEEHDLLLVDWLTELLYLFESRRLLLCEFRAEITDGALTATASGEPYDSERHELANEVKAITYHALRVEPTDDGWLAEVIIDI